MDERESESAELFAEQTGLLEYEIAHGISRDVARRHQTIRRLIAQTGGIVPTISDLRMSLLVKGFKCSKQTIRNDLKNMGWR